jgi:O-antigen ligase
MRFRDWVTALSALAATAIAILAVGGVHRWAQAVVALLVAVSIAGTVASRRGLGRRSPLVVGLSIALGLTLIQLVPLPAGLLQSLSPAATALRADGSALLGLSPWQALTTDAPATIAAAVVFLALLGLAIVTLRMATSERGRYRILCVVGALCGVTAAIVGIHHLLDLRALYGVYEPEYAAPRMLGPLLNANSLACLTAVGATICIGLAAYPRQPGWVRAIWLVVVAGCGAVTVATVSRGATIAFVGGSLITIALLVGQRLLNTDGSKRRRSRFITNALPIGIVAGCMIVLVIYSNASMVERQISEISVQEFHQTRSKYAAWQSATKLIEEAPILGIGRGSFETNFTRVHAPSGISIYSHVENEYLQAVVDWGIAGALALGVVAIWLVIVAIRRWRDGPLAAGALGALAVVAMQSNVDFGLELLGLAAPLTAIAATLTYVPLRDAKHLQVARGVRLVHVLALLAGAVLLLSRVTTSLPEDHRALQRTPSLAVVRGALERHPLDYYGYAVAAEVLDRRRDPRAIRILNHAMTLHPTHPGMHRLAAQMLMREQFVAQATVEYAEALRRSLEPRKLLQEILARFPVNEAASCIPLDYGAPEDMLQIITELGRVDVAIEWLARVLKNKPGDSRACDLLYALTLRERSLRAGELIAQRCLTYLPDYQTRLDTAQLLAGNKAYSAVIQLLADVDTWQSRVDDKITAWLVLCDAHAGLGSVDDAKRCLRRLDASPDMRVERRNEILTRLDAFAKGTALSPGLTTPAPTDSAGATGSAAPSK